MKRVQEYLADSPTVVFVGPRRVLFEEAGDDGGIPAPP